ncbi:PREDICTED: formin-like protein 3 [Bactrocera latifrons]|uniref:formin-like protein 3 n=1 Tax=Bactrocera latifrons TaxID=174628 RepID=UPI0008DDAAF5|nr:PREDICTED: formin-like protein 3 [Bactrocera latifrons]
MKFVGLFVISVCLAECALLNVQELSGENLNYGALPTYSALKEYASKLNGNSLLQAQYGNSFFPYLTADQNAISSPYLDFIRPQFSVPSNSEVWKPALSNENIISNSNLHAENTQNSFSESLNLQPQPANPISVINVPQSPLEKPTAMLNNPQSQPQNPSNVNVLAIPQTPTVNIQYPPSSQLSSNIQASPTQPQNLTANVQQPPAQEISSSNKFPQSGPQTPTTNVQYPPATELSSTIKLPQPPPQTPTTNVQNPPSPELSSTIKLPQPPPQTPTANGQYPPSSELSSTIKLPKPPPQTSTTNVQLSSNIQLPQPPKAQSNAINRPAPLSSIGQNRPRPPVSGIQG